jgi:hypothetical protein
MHSLGGGTGSGLGTYILGRLEDQYASTYRFTTAVFPSEDDDVITSPYNSVLAIHELVQHANCVLPIENQALMDMCAKIPHRNHGKGTVVAAANGSGRSSGSSSSTVRSSLIDMPPIVKSWSGRNSSMKTGRTKSGALGGGGGGGVGAVVVVVATTVATTAATTGEGPG